MSDEKIFKIDEEYKEILEKIKLEKEKQENEDFEGLDNLGFSKKIINRIKEARMFAKDIVNSLEPKHITGWFDLKIKLENALQVVKTEIISEKTKEEIVKLNEKFKRIKKGGENDTYE